MSTNYVQTRWYRAPELLLNYKIVSKQADMWSIGCIFAELLTGRPILTGSSPVNQIEKIIAMLGTPSLSDVKGSSDGIDFIKKMGFRVSRPLAEYFPNVRNPLAIDLLSKLLKFNPEQRISADEAVKHPYMSQFYDSSVVTTCPIKFNYDFENGLVDTRSIKIETYTTMLSINGLDTSEFERFVNIESPVTQGIDSLGNNMYSITCK